MKDWILMTGFGPFPGVVLNPTQILVQNLARLQLPNHDVVVAVLDVSFTRSAEQLHAILHGAKTEPSAIIHFGVSRDPRFRIEHRAINCKRASVPDVDGQHFSGMPIDDRYDTARALYTDIAIDPLVVHLNQAGFPTRSSKDAGRYVCNSTYFHSLSYVQECSARPKSIFVHVPPLGSTYEQVGEVMTWTEELQLAASQSLVRWICSVISGANAPRL